MKKRIFLLLLAIAMALMGIVTMASADQRASPSEVVMFCQSHYDSIVTMKVPKGADMPVAGAVNITNAETEYLQAVAAATAPIGGTSAYDLINGYDTIAPISTGTQLGAMAEDPAFSETMPINTSAINPADTTMANTILDEAQYFTVATDPIGNAPFQLAAIAIDQAVILGHTPDEAFMQGETQQTKFIPSALSAEAIIVNVRTDLGHFRA